jgi:Flp pilus assembly protein TadG
MIRCKKIERSERGATLLEFSICATVFLTAIFGVLEFGRALWTHNALSDAARRGARYAINQPASTPAGTTVTGTNVGPSLTAIKNVTVYGNSAGTGQPLVNNLATSNVNVTYSNFGLGNGSVSVTITNYTFQFIVPIVGTSISMPNYNTTLTGESVGTTPAPL